MLYTTFTTNLKLPLLKNLYSYLVELVNCCKKGNIFIHTWILENFYVAFRYICFLSCDPRLPWHQHKDGSPCSTFSLQCTLWLPWRIHPLAWKSSNTCTWIFQGLQIFDFKTQLALFGCNNLWPLKIAFSAFLKAPTDV